MKPLFILIALLFATSTVMAAHFDFAPTAIHKDKKDKHDKKKTAPLNHMAMEAKAP